MAATLDENDIYILHVAFGWAEVHLYHFIVSESRAAGEPYQFFRPNKELLSIQDSDDDWDEQDDMIVQMALVTGRPAPRVVPKALASECTLASVFANPQFADGKAEVTYEYDFGNGWIHEIVCLGKADADGEFARRQIGKGVVDGQWTWCIGGEGHPCAEDCGGSGGWKELKQAFADGAHGGERVDELRTWYRTHCLNGEREGLNPWKWDIFEVNQRLASLHC
ncbi:hypothetical protein BFW01_g417 [Lasiodiplodia theobromae]|uniref:Plasmid pRiA4b Orf3-like domain-containing protein n=1 Tax=Lasiodiplodia theobromae TaxID=45133 RepID=A0A8H7IRG5_9PEZI|nr:hypothetical protein BFW01_g417 [Lasiodiplodia theobromae]